MFWNNFLDLCIKSDKSPTAVIKELGLSRGSVTHWKEGKTPHFSTIKKISDYFGVAPDYLLGKEEGSLPENKKAPGIKPNAVILDDKKIFMIGVYESISAGFGAYPSESVIDYTPLFLSSAEEAANTICVKVRGDSMYPKIEDGDVIQLHKQDSVDSGSIAAVLIDGDDALVKKIIYGADGVELHSINPMYPVMHFNGADAERVTVLGAVKKIIKNV